MRNLGRERERTERSVESSFVIDETKAESVIPTEWDIYTQA